MKWALRLFVVLGATVVIAFDVRAGIGPVVDQSRAKSESALPAFPRPAPQPEPIWGEKTFGQWLAQLKSEDADQRLAALKVFEQMLSFADLGRCCLAPCPRLDQLGIGDEPEAIHAFVAVLRDPETDVRAEAAQLLVSCGPYAEPAVPRLTEMLRNRRTARQSLLALAAIGKQAAAGLPEIRLKLGDKDPQVRFAAAQAMWAIDRDPMAIEVCSSLLTLDGFRRSDVLVFMSQRMGPRAAPAVPSVIRLLDTEAALDQPTRNRPDWLFSSIDLLGSIGPEAKAAVPTLMRLLANDALQYSCCRALGRIGPGAKDAVPAIVALLRRDGNDYARRRDAVRMMGRAEAIRALGGIGAAAVEAIPELAQQLRSAEGDSRHAAIEALGKIGIAAKPVIPQMNEYLDDPQLRGAIALARWRISRDPESVSILIESLKTNNFGALAAVADLGKDAAAAAPALRSILQANGPLANARSAEALWLVACDPESLVWLERAMKAGKPGSPAAAAALWRIDRRPGAKSFLLQAQYRKELHAETEGLVSQLWTEF